MSLSASLTQRPLVVGRFGGEFAVGTDGEDQFAALADRESRLFGQQHVEVDFAEGRGLVNDAGAAIGRDELGRHDPPGDVLRVAAG